VKDAAPAHDTAALARRVRDAALALGFGRVGFAPVEPFARGERALADWLASDKHGTMAYMAEQGPRAEPRALLPEARSLVVVALVYDKGGLPLVDGGPRGTVARYARGTDYHLVLRDKLRALADACSTIVGRPVLARSCTDTAPILEREAAARAGVGFIAKSTMAIVPGLGTYVLLGELLLDVELTYDEPLESRCGECTACLTACPTGAFVGPHVLDARKCISYLTIELRGPIPRELRSKMGTMVFGCDICQEVCPFNASSKARASAPELAPRGALTYPPLVDLLTLRNRAHKRLTARTALRRISRQQLQRNAAVALGNARDPGTVPALCHVLQESSSPLVREHVAWALGRIGGAMARAALEQAASDPDERVRTEAQTALLSADGASSPLA
jgi:epoxyqueuosine reductase